jgi:hypothetical protein
VNEEANTKVALSFLAHLSAGEIELPRPDLITKTIFIAKGFRAHSTNFFRHKKFFLDYGAKVGVSCELGCFWR